MARKQKHRRNDALLDRWSFVHLLTGASLVLLLPSVDILLIWLIMFLWEPLEIFVLSPALARVGIIFGYETWRNSLSDIFFNTLGIFLGVLMIILPR